ncbi:MAG: hypothetical protein CYPHOPRED_001577 [Cyphobasidiales sp. Tagirdzhanova-0007]|nr:MAG: hypothetical protein CYPHOPRED_001577 [Cyphobasidiales sp. Tagirdzhanova-0007]
MSQARGLNIRNVLGSPLAICSTSPITGFKRNGYCDSDPSDFGKHYLAAEVTDEFLEFSAKQGNDLRSGMGQPGGGKTGLSGGCKWCLCVARWKEAFDARGTMGDMVVPKVLLEATHEDTLKSGISLKDLQMFAKTPSSG